MSNIRWILTAGFLLLNAVYDKKSHRICLPATIVAGMAGVWFVLYDGFVFGENNLASLGMMCFLLFLSKVTKEAIGAGDALVIGVVGMLTGYRNMFLMCFLAWLAVGGYALFLLIIRKKNKRYEIPFVPFLFVAFLITQGGRLYGI